MIGVVGDDEASGLAERLRAAGESVTTGGAVQVADHDPDLLVTLGERALIDLVRADTEGPVLPVGEIAGLPAVSQDALTAIVDELVERAYTTRDHRLLSVSANGDAIGPAVFEVLLVRAEPGRISEFGLGAPGTRTRFRADGVCVATPAGSHGYAVAAGGPRLGPNSGGTAVVPVAPFGLGAPTWVFHADEDIRLTVERDEGEVTVLLDGRERHRLTGSSSVVVTGGRALTVAELPGR